MRVAYIAGHNANWRTKYAKKRKEPIINCSIVCKDEKKIQLEYF